MNNNFNLKQFLSEGRLLKEDSLQQDVKNFVDSVEIDNYQRSKDNDPDYEEVEPTVEFFLDMYPEYKGRENEIQQILNNKGNSLNEDAQVDENLIKSIFDEKVQDDYKPLIGTESIYDGLEEVLNSPETFQKVAEWVKDQVESSGEDLEEGDEAGYASDATDYMIMETFAPRLVQNLLKIGFTYDKEEDSWTVPEDYYDITDYEVLTSYGIIYDIWGLGGDYDTSPRETISQFLKRAAQA